MLRLFLAAMLAAIAMPAQAVVIYEFKGNFQEYTYDQDQRPGDYRLNTIGRLELSGPCWASCMVGTRPNGATTLEAIGYYLTFKFDESVPLPIEPGVWHPVTGELDWITGYIVGSRFAVQLTEARIYDDGEVCCGSSHYPVATFISQFPVPEPATWAMMLTGFGFLGLALRQRAPVVTVGGDPC